MQKNTKRIPNRNSEQIVYLIRRRAENLFETHQLYCSEAVLYVINRSLNGGLPPDVAIRMASGFSEGVGGAGCSCGAFSGAVMAVGLFLGRKSLSGSGLQKVLQRSREVHDRFQSQFGATCCRILSRPLADDPRALFAQCTQHTGEGAELAARIILKERPELAGQADLEFLNARDSNIGAGFKRLLSLVK